MFNYINLNNGLIQTINGHQYKSDGDMVINIV